MSTKISVFGQKTSADLPKLLSRCLGSILKRKQFLGKNYLFFYEFRIFNATLLAFSHKFFSRVVKNPIYVRTRKSWEKIHFRGKKFHHFRILRKTINFLSEIVRQCCQNCILRVRRKIFWEEEFLEVFSSFSDIKWMISRCFVKHWTIALSKMHSTRT